MNLIYQVAVGKVPAYYEMCIASVKRYCDKYGFNHIVQREPKLRITPTDKRHRVGKAAMKLDYLPIYEKENAFAHLPYYDNVCIIDADIYIREPCANIFSYVDKNAAFAGVRECDLPLTPKYLKKIQGFSRAQYQNFPEIMKEDTPEYGVPFYNMGMMILNNSITEYLTKAEIRDPSKFIRRPEFEGFVNGEGHWKWSTDQTLLNYWVKTSGMPTHNMQWKWNALVKAVRDEELFKSHFLHFVLASNLPNPERTVQMIADDPHKAKTLNWGHG